MTPEEIKRTIEFILQHQASAAVRMDETDRHLQETDKHLRDLSESTSRRIMELADSTNRQILEMADSTNRLIQEYAESTGAQIRGLAASTSQFQDDVKGFIKVVVPILEIQSKRLDRLEGLS
jgi:hypothetical protein